MEVKTSRNPTQQQLIVDLHNNLDKMNWPKVLYVKDGKTFQDLVVALRTQVKVDWHFEETDEGFPYFLLGPTMVRVDNQGQPSSARLNELGDEEQFARQWANLDEPKASGPVPIDLNSKIREMVEDGDIRIAEVTNAGETS